MDLKNYLEDLKDNVRYQYLDSSIRLESNISLNVYNITNLRFETPFIVDEIKYNLFEEPIYVIEYGFNGRRLAIKLDKEKLFNFDYIILTTVSDSYFIFYNLRTLVEFLSNSESSGVYSFAPMLLREMIELQVE